MTKTQGGKPCFYVTIMGETVQMYLNSDATENVGDISKTLNRYLLDPQNNFDDIERLFMMCRHDCLVIPVFFAKALRMCNNMESSAFLFAEIYKKTNMDVFLNCVSDSLQEMSAPETPDEYIDTISGGHNATIISYVKLAGRFFNNDKMAMSDHYTNRTLALIQPSSTMPHGYDMAKTNCNEAVIDAWQKKTKKDFRPMEMNDVKMYHKKWVQDQDKEHIAKYVGDFLKYVGGNSVLEIGCHAGTLLSMIHDHIQIDLYGVERDLDPVEFGKKEFPHLNLYHGTHEDVLSGKIELPEQIDVLLLSYMCLINNSESLDDILSVADKMCNHIVIVDDITNIDGNRAIVRGKYMLHPYRKILKKNGFDIIDKEMLWVPTMAARHVLLASKKLVDYKPDRYKSDKFRFYTRAQVCLEL